MKQTQRDLTYRLDALNTTCDIYGRNSEACKESTQIWKMQYNGNIFYERVSFIVFIMFIAFCVIFFALKLYAVIIIKNEKTKSI